MTPLGFLLDLGLLGGEIVVSNLEWFALVAVCTYLVWCRIEGPGPLLPVIDGVCMTCYRCQYECLCPQKRDET